MNKQHLILESLHQKVNEDNSHDKIKDALYDLVKKYEKAMSKRDENPRYEKLIAKYEKEWTDKFGMKGEPDIETVNKFNANRDMVKKNVFDEYAIVTPKGVLTGFRNPNGRSIEKHTFQLGSILVKVPGSVKSIGSEAFTLVSDVISVELGEGVEYIDSYAFSESQVKRIKLPNSLKSIGDCAFQGSSLEKIKIPAGVKKLNSHSLEWCRNLVSVDLPEGMTDLGDYTFDHCRKLESITIPNSVKSIGNRAFYDCGLTSVTIPNSVTSIGEGAFCDCSKLTSVTIGNSVKSISDKAFAGCKELESIKIPNSVTSIGKNVFSKRGAFEVIYKGTEEEWETLKRNCKDSTIKSKNPTFIK